VHLGDEITAFNGEEVRSANQLATLVGVLPEMSWVSLAYRPQLPTGGYGTERTVHLKLPRLDTGSSRDSDRIGSEEQRAVAAAALSRDVGAGAASVEGATVEFVDPAGQHVLLQRLGDRLSLSIGETRLVHDGGEGFKTVGGDVLPLTAEDRVRLERELGTNPWLWTGPDRKRLIEGALLAGGVLVHGRPAYRLELSGEGQREIYCFEDGTPAGYRFRDPLRRALVELRVHAARSGRGEVPMRLVADGELEIGWKFIPPAYDPLPAEGLFKRPGR
jgi:hypothetical protein